MKVSASHGPRVCILASLIAIVGGVLALTPGAREAFDQQLARYELYCLLHAEGDDATICAQALANHGPTALPQMAAALTAPRAVVAQAALHALQHEIASWDALPPGEADRRLRLLAAALAAHVNELSPSGRQLAKRQATRLLNENRNLNSGDALHACETILQATASNVPPADVAARSAELLARAEALQPRDRSEQAADTADEQMLAARSLPLPGGGLPTVKGSVSPLTLDENGAAERLAANATSNTSSANRDGSGRDNTEEGRAEGLAMAPLRISLGDASFQSTSAANQKPVLQVVSPPIVQAVAVQSDVTPESHVRRASQLEQPLARRALPGDAEDDAALRCMYRLHDDDAEVVAAAEDELAGRGYGQPELELARRLTDEDPAVRCQLAEILPGIGGIDTKLWLTWLSRDRVADVRLAALGVMATTGNAQMLKHVARVSAEDDDARIQKLGERLSEPANSGRSTR